MGHFNPSLFLQCRSWCWCGDIVNYIEAFILAYLILFIICGVVVSDVPSGLGTMEGAGWIVMSAFVVVISTGSLTRETMKRPWCVGGNGHSRCKQVVIKHRQVESKRIGDAFLALDC